jgi:hypothetical protein
VNQESLRSQRMTNQAVHDPIELFTAPQIIDVAVHDSDAYVLWSELRLDGRAAIQSTARGDERWLLGRIDVVSGEYATIADRLRSASLLAADDRGVLLWDHRGPHGAPLTLRAGCAAVWSVGELDRSSRGDFGLSHDRIVAARGDGLVSIERMTGVVKRLSIFGNPDSMCASDGGFAIVIDGRLFVSEFDPVDLREVPIPGTDRRSVRVRVDDGALILSLDDQHELGAPFADLLAGAAVEALPSRVLERRIVDLPDGRKRTQIERRGRVVWQSEPLSLRTMRDFDGGVPYFVEVGADLLLLRRATADEPRRDDRLIRATA